MLLRQIRARVSVRNCALQESDQSPPVYTTLRCLVVLLSPFNTCLVYLDIFIRHHVYVHILFHPLKPFYMVTEVTEGSI